MWDVSVPNFGVLPSADMERYIFKIQDRWVSMSKSEGPKIKKANIRLTDGSHVKGQINIKDHDRLSDLINFAEDPFIVVFNATIPGGLDGKVIFVSKSQVLWICPED
jgi:hypothetical protein